VLSDIILTVGRNGGLFIEVLQIWERRFYENMGRDDDLKVRDGGTSVNSGNSGNKFASDSSGAA
jgi:hypothetical protein